MATEEFPQTARQTPLKMKGHNTKTLKHYYLKNIKCCFHLVTHIFWYCTVYPSLKKSVHMWKGYYINVKTGGTAVAGRPVGTGGDGDGLSGTGIPIIGAKPGTLVIHATESRYILMQRNLLIYLATN